MKRQETSELSAKEEFLIELRRLLSGQKCRDDQEIEGFGDYLTSIAQPFDQDTQRFREFLHKHSGEIKEIKKWLDVAKDNLNENESRYLGALKNLKKIYSALSLNIKPRMISKDEFNKKFFHELRFLSGRRQASQHLLELSSQVRCVLSDLLADPPIPVDDYEVSDKEGLLIIADQLEFLARNQVDITGWQKAIEIINGQWKLIDV